MFLTADITRFRNSEFIQFLKNLLQIIKSFTLLLEKLQSKVTPLDNEVNDMTNIFKPERGSSITQDIVDLDGRRDFALTGLEKLLEGMTNHFNQDTADAAQALLDTLNNFGSGLARMNYQAETSVISSLIEKWKSEDELVAAVATLNIEAWVNELDEANTLFNNRYLNRVKESAQAPEIKLADLRKLATGHYRELLKYITAYATLDETNSYDPLIREVNQLIEQYNRLITQREAKEPKEAEETEQA
ncbi:hypothetical protein DMA11_08435 [Marinilabiliaceae bacterium JC017]|nr:hypothetical protein DMA11_08435 [Marinilabiliaceae bacterium JC017]